MKSLIALTTALFLAGSVHAQSCCETGSHKTGPSATAKFAKLAADSTFRMSHQEPMGKGETMTTGGTMITIPVADGKPAFAFEVKPATQTSNVLLVFHEWWGLNDHIRAEAIRLADSLGSVRVLALDLYDGKVTAKREEAGQLMQASTAERSQAIIRGALQYVGKDANVLTVGWCFGGGWSHQAALLAGKQASASVIYYGMPESDPEKLKSLHADVLGIFARKDGWINEKVVSSFESAMKTAGKPVTIAWYEADHAFANPSNPKHDGTMAADAMRKTVAFLRSHLK